MWRTYFIEPYFDGDDPDVPGWKIFMIEGNGGWSVQNAFDPAKWRVQAHLTDAQHAVMIEHPSVSVD